MIISVDSKFVNAYNGYIQSKQHLLGLTDMKNSQLFKQATATALPFTIFFAIMCVIMAILFAVSYAFANAGNANDNSQTVTTKDSVEVMFDNIQAAIDDSGVEGITIVYNK